MPRNVVCRMSVGFGTRDAPWRAARQVAAVAGGLHGGPRWARPIPSTITNFS
ncbi:hypothetical protein BUH_1539 [Burkholderia pseudomallei Pakistan 9]|nr:hypothetical protein BUH_1539 [Burkholderia pseudomallei Pakistan 9]